MESGPGSSQPQIGGRKPSGWFSSKPYCLLLGVAFFLLLSNASLMTLLQLCIRDFGGSTALIGTATAISAASEMPGMFLMAYLMTKVGQKRLLVLSGAAYMIRMFVTAAMGTVQGLIWVQLLQGITYAVLLPVSMSYLSQIVDQRVRSTAVTTYTAVTGSLTGILANLITSAFLATGFSPRHALVFFGFSALLGLGLALYGWARGIWDVQPGKGRRDGVGSWKMFPPQATCLCPALGACSSFRSPPLLKTFARPRLCRSRRQSPSPSRWRYSERAPNAPQMPYGFLSFCAMLIPGGNCLCTSF